MAYGDYDGPNKADKGLEGGSCNRTRCQAPNAIWYNHGSLAWYCERCRRDIQFDSFNLRNWEREWQPRLGHPMFETREMMAARDKPKIEWHSSNDVVPFDVVASAIGRENAVSLSRMVHAANGKKDKEAR